MRGSISLDARVRLSLRDVRHRRHDRPARRSAHSSRVSGGLSSDLSAGRRQRPRDYGLVDRRQLTARAGERRGARVRRADRRAAMDVASDTAGSERIPAFATWRDGSAARTGAANVWSIMTADPARDLIFVPTSSAAPDYYGALRLGDNRYANSIVALRASTGRVVWHFQTVHHDLWDYDNASPPALVNGHARRQIHSSGRAGDEDRACCSCCIARPACRSFRWRSAKFPRARFPAKKPSPTQPFTTVTPSAEPAQLHRGSGIRHKPGGTGGMQSR